MENEYEVRPMLLRDLPEIAAIHVEGWQVAYNNFLPAAFLNKFDVEENITWMREWLDDPVSPPRGFVAWIGEQAAGFVLAGPNNEPEIPCDAEIHKWFVRPAYQGKGIGRALLNAAAVMLAQAGYETVAVWSFEESASCGYYQQLDGQIVYRTVQDPGGRETPVVVFSWDLSTLVARTQP